MAKPNDPHIAAMMMKRLSSDVVEMCRRLPPLLRICGGTESEVVWVPANMVLKLILLSGTLRADVSPVSAVAGCVDILAVSLCSKVLVLSKLFELPWKPDSLLRS